MVGHGLNLRPQHVGIGKRGPRGSWGSKSTRPLIGARPGPALMLRLAALLCVTLTFSAIAEEAPSGPTGFLEKHKQALNGNPPGVQLTIRFEGGRNRFRQGEMIRVELAFSSSLPQTYEVDGATYDRSGRLHCDSFHLDPRSGAVDPIREYFERGPHIGGGIRSTPVLETKPYQITRELNEHLRIDKPGTYRMFVTSGRVTGERPSRDGDSGTVGFRTTSRNVLEFEILPPDQAWSNEQLRRIRIDLGSGDYEKRRTAMRRLRYLGTKEAVPELIRLFRSGPGNQEWEAKLGLIGSPHREVVVGAMQAGLTSPGQPVTQTYIWTLALLHFVSQDLPQLPKLTDSSDKKLREQRSEVYRIREEKRQELTRNLIVMLAGALPLKKGHARAITLKTLLEMTGMSQHLRSVLPSDIAKRLREQIAEVFEELPTKEQSHLLYNRWRLMRGEHMLPVLRRIYQNTHPTVHRVRGAALKRIYDLKPDEGRELILKEIQDCNPTRQIRFLALMILPKRPIAQLDEALVERVRRYRGNGGCQLLERYGTATVLPRVQDIYEEGGHFDERSRAALLAYFLRWRPKEGAKYIRQAVPSSTPNRIGGSISLLSEIGKREYRPELEEIALDLLNHRNLAVVADAANLLGKHGSPAAEGPLWQRLAQWHENWKDRGEELRLNRIDSTKPNWQAILAGSSLRQALLRGQAWLCGPEGIRKVHAMCPDPQDGLQIEYLLPRWRGQKMSLSFSPRWDEWGSISVAQYECKSLGAAKAKIAQFPKGTVFVWQTYANDPERERKQPVFSELKPFIEKQGMVLESQ